MKYKLSTFNFQLSTFLLSVVLFASPLKAQVTIGAQTAPQTFSTLELTTGKIKGGLRLPQLTTQQRDSISDILMLDVNQEAAKGLVIFNTDTKCLEFWNSVSWISLCGDVPAGSSSTSEPLQGKATKNGDGTSLKQ